MTAQTTPFSLTKAFRSQGGVLLALMLRDVRTRMFGSAFGYIVVIAWPLSHILLLVMIYSAMGRIPPFGYSMAMWTASGVVPFMCFSYMARFIMMSVVHNKPLLYFPRIRVTDVIIARACLELLSAALVVILVLAIFSASNLPVTPADPVTSAQALLAACALGLGMGALNAVITGSAPAWATGYALLNIFLWLTSGVLFVPAQLPQVAQDLLAYNPVVHVLEWNRTGFYADYYAPFLSKTYVLSMAGFLFFVGLAFARLFRGKLNP